MPAISMSAVRSAIAAEKLGPLYALVGADELEKAAVAQEFIDSVDEGLQAFNVERFYGAETDVDALTDAAATFPMMAPRRIIMIFAAEGLLIPKRESKAAEEAQERLETFIEAPPDHATVVFVCGDIDRRRRAVKRLLERAQVVDCGTIDTPEDAERWVKARAAKAGVPLDADAIRALVRRVGPDIVKLRAGIDRVATYAMGQPAISANDVRESVPAGPDSVQDFGISNAIEKGDASGALEQLGAALEAGLAPEFLLGQVRLAAERSSTARLRSALDAVLRTDLAFKSTGGDKRALLQRLVVELCPVGARPGASGAGRFSPGSRPPFRR